MIKDLTPIQQMANQYEHSILVMVNTFINWFNSSFEYGEPPETLYH
jgi:hypothetical protein